LPDVSGGVSRDPDWWSHEVAITGLGNLGDARAIEPLRTLLERSENDQGTEAARAALRQLVGD
ncbi:MAG TPA: HEAT repeat domain-containing protein, partial [Ktedonobacterales bacterium]|nr:HEAT repeat domain-containing protein [Ktedonobacterales bacterium]